MKYIDAEKLIVEIENRLHCNGAFDEVGDSQWHYDQGMVDAYKHVKDFIASLQQEHPEVGKAANEYLHKWDIDGIPTTSYTWDDLVDCFRAGAEWQKQQMVEEA